MAKIDKFPFYGTVSRTNGRLWYWQLNIAGGSVIASDEVMGDDEGPAVAALEKALAEKLHELRQQLATVRVPAVAAPDDGSVGTGVDGDAHEGFYKPEPSVEPIPMLLWCPGCGMRHEDLGEFATKPHRTHACGQCGMVWRPALVPTVGVRFLPGYKNESFGELFREPGAAK